MIAIDIVLDRGAFALDAGIDAPGGVTSLFGPSGAGKSTVAQAVAGLLRPLRGRIAVGGETLFDSARGVNLPARRRRVGYVFQDGRLFPHMTVARNLRYGGNRDEARIVDMLGLAPLMDRRPGTLSGGERQRVALGRALMAGPRLLIMDEPLSALDAPRKAEILPYLERLRDAAGLPILHVSHDVSEVARLATTLVLMERGRVVRAGPLEEILSDPGAVRLIGVREAGAVLTATIRGFDPGDELTELSVSAGRLVLPGRLGAEGARIRLRVPAQEIILASERPRGISALNVLPVTVTAVVRGQGPGVAVGLAAGEDRLLARITRRSAEALGLREGQALHAIVKATAVARRDVGG